MHRIQTIAGAVDLADSALDVVRAATLLAEAGEGTRLFFVHAVTPIPPAFEPVLYPYAGLGDDAEAIHAEMVENATALVGQRVKEVGGDGKNSEIDVRYGEAEKTLIEQLARLGPDLVVAGRSDRERERPGAGSVARVLARRSPAPVLLVQRLDKSYRLQRIVFACDLAENAQHHLHSVVALAHAVGGSVSPVAVVTDGGSLDHAGIVGGLPQRVAQRCASAARKRWEAIASEGEPPFELSEALDERVDMPVFPIGDPADEILTHAANRSADLIVIGRCASNRNPTSHLGRVASSVIERARCPVLVLPPVEASESR